MTTTDQRTQLVMSEATFSALMVRAQIRAGDFGADSLMRALRLARQVLGDGPDGKWRVACDIAALAFIRDQAPEIARLWPAVFGDVTVPRSSMLIEVAAAIGQTVSGMEVIDGRLRLVFASGDALLIGAEAEIDWRPA